MANDYDVAVIGGGLVGSAIAWGLAKAGQRVAVLDEGDVAYRASRGNFALVWVQNKGLGMPEYGAWTMRSANAWQGLADALREQTGIDVVFQRPGGFHFALSERELEARVAQLKRLHAQPGMERFRQMRDARPRRGETADPADRPRSRRRELQRARRPCEFAAPSGRSTPACSSSASPTSADHVVDRIAHTAASSASPRAAAKSAPARSCSRPASATRGSRRWSASTCRCARSAASSSSPRRRRPFLHYPVQTVRQTDEGGVMIGDSQEEAGLDASVGHAVIAVLADRAVRMFPKLASLNIVRTWAALRVMTPDGFPIYDHSSECPGAFVATCHSGVTLAANHALALPDRIIEGSLAGRDIPGVQLPEVPCSEGCLRPLRRCTSPSTAGRSRRAKATRSPRRCSPPASIVAARRRSPARRARPTA